MTREELIRQCRFYKGEEECPYESDISNKDYDERNYLWRMEEWWVQRSGVFCGCWFDKEGRLGDEEWEEYKSHGGKEFSDIPDSLLSFFWHGFLKTHEYGYKIEDFYKRIDDYLNTPKE